MTDGRTPPRYVPTLTEIVRPTTGPVGEPPLSPEDVVRRVLDQVDATFEQRLHEALAAAVIDQARALGPRLREEIEAAVRLAVAEAFEAGAGRSDRP